MLIGLGAVTLVAMLLTVRTSGVERLLTLILWATYGIYAIGAPI